ncbi:hypothetical protein LAZ67_10002227 [Cordylochernes scorpioides]|uniref:Zinc finger BED domain-containing protein 5 n=1 Tax=Cordylochernes scorpioides TaxID=51811 RepID=A0ABY6KWI6_9ARAC|nr:hypothetical protein LAZ67_10002227 [Cordylochernes scorpioides]
MSFTKRLRAHEQKKQLLGRLREVMGRVTELESQMKSLSSASTLSMSSGSTSSLSSLDLYDLEDRLLALSPICEDHGGSSTESVAGDSGVFEPASCKPADFFPETAQLLISLSEKQNQNENKEDKKIVKSTGNKRKYVEDYLKYGFIPSVNDPSLPFCLICQKTLSNETMVPSKLLRHIETNHREQMNNPISYFENIRSSFQKQSKKLKKFMTTSDEAQTASYMIAQLIARKKKAHAEAEEIILPALKIVAGCMLTNDAMEKVTKIPLSSKTIARRIEDMSEDIELQIKQSFNDSSTKWAIQLDETTDISNKAQLLAFLRFVDTGKIVNNYFFCKELKQRTTGADIFELVDENVMKYNLRWENCVSVCTDGAPAMKDEVVKVVNYIKSNALRSRIFSTFCEAMDSDDKNLLFHTEVRWLSKGKALNRFISMKNEIMAFIDNEEINFPFMMSDVWWLQVSFLGDIFDKLNSLNLNLQGAQENIITISTKLKAFKEKLSLWNLNIAKENFAFFPMVQENPSKSIIKKEVEETLTLLSASFDKYFPYLDVEKMEWVFSPFMHCEIQHLEEEMQENLIDLKNDLVFKRLFTEKELSEFWLCLNSKFPKLSNAAIESLLPFGSSYLCEQGFSTLTEMKSKKRERLQMLDEEMRVCLSQCVCLSTRYQEEEEVLGVTLERARNLGALSLCPGSPVQFHLALLPGTELPESSPPLEGPELGWGCQLPVAPAMLPTKTLQVAVWAEGECVGSSQVSLAEFDSSRWYNVLSFRLMNTVVTEANSSDDSTVISSQTSTLTRNQDSHLAELEEEDQEGNSEDEEDYEDVETCDKETNTECVFLPERRGGEGTSRTSHSVVKRSQTFSPCVSKQYVCRLSRSDSDSAMALHRGKPFQRHGAGRRSVRWRWRETARTSLDLALDLQASRARLELLRQELTRLKDVKARLEQAKLRGDHGLPDWLMASTQLLNLTDDRRVQRRLRKTSREINRLRRSRTRQQPDLEAFREKMVFFSRLNVRVPEVV